MNQKDFEKFNKIYRLPINKKPTLLPIERLKNFKDIITDEISEVSLIIAGQKEAKTDSQKLDVLVAIADWYADIIWYVRSEAVKYGLNMEDVLDLIKESNFSKLDEDGNAIYDSRGKVCRGKNYIAPEIKIKKYLKQKSLNTSSYSI